MKKFLYIALLAAASFGATSCKKDPTLPTPAVEEFPQIYTVVDTRSNLKVTDIQGSGNPAAVVALDLRGGDLSKVQSIEISRTFRGFNVPSGTATPTLGFGPTVVLRTVPAASGDVTITVNDLIAGLTRASGASQAGARTPITRTSLRSGESFLLTYALLLVDGRRIDYGPAFNNAPFSGYITVVP